MNVLYLFIEVAGKKKWLLSLKRDYTIVILEKTKGFFMYVGGLRDYEDVIYQILDVRQLDD